MIGEVGREPLWRRTDRTAPALGDAALTGRFDAVVVGAGLVGLSCAVMLAEAGQRVAVLEARRIGAGTTGASTAKVSLLQGTRLSAIRDRQGTELAQAYLTGNRAGQDWVLRQAESGGVSVQRRAAVTYAAGPAGLDAVRQEAAVARELGLPVTWRDDDDVPFPFAGAVALADQAQVDPLALLHALTTRALALGCVIREHTRVQAVRGGTVVTDRGGVEGERVVLATGIPFLDSAGFFARVEPQRSYALAVRATDDSAMDMYLSADSPTRSIRTATVAGEPYLLVGGNGHVVGRASEEWPGGEREAAEDLERWTRRHFDLPPAAAWSAQDYHPARELPYAGPAYPWADRVLVATGFAKWGMAAGPAAAMVITGTILGREPEWARAFDTWTASELRGLGEATRYGAHVARRLVADRAASASGPDPGPPDAGAVPDGEGRVSGGPFRPTATSSVDGVVRSVSATCSHMGGVLCWNGAERTWDCPLHGSRFAPDGAVLEGPATRDLRPS